MNGYGNVGVFPENKSTMPLPDNRKAEIRQELISLLEKLLPAASLNADPQRSFLDMGANSLTFMQIGQVVEKNFRVTIQVRQFFEALTNLDALVAYIDQMLPPDNDNEPSPPSAESEPHGSIAASAAFEPSSPGAFPVSSKQDSTLLSSGLEWIFAQQLEMASDAVSQVVAQQLDFLGRNKSHPGGGQRSDSVRQMDKPVIERLQEKHPPKADLSSQPTSHFQARALSPQQQRYLDNFIARYTYKTSKSKALAKQYHPVLADVRSIMGFSPEIKEVFYPIFAERSQGSRIWDVDGNEYVDIAMGSGVYLFGHDTAFVREAVETQLQQGMQLGPQSRLAGEVAELICEFTGMERVAFCCSGTEAVMTALRLARAATGRTKIVQFLGAYHGHFDGTLAIPHTADGATNTIPLVPGTPQRYVEETLVLNFDDPQSLEIIRSHAHELAAVLVEPVQSRRPDVQPRAFLKKLRELTRETGVPLIFDEMITGFRVHPGGAQAWFGVEADLATYGKILGGGLPIGIVAGQAKFLDHIDGGSWHYGDGSVPEVETTYAAGTFRKHPLSLAAARAVLLYIKDQGPAFYAQLNQRTAQFADSLNTYFQEADLPLKVDYFGSLFRFVMSGNYSYLFQPIEMDLLFYHLIARGIYLWEGRTCFFTSAHSDKDIAHLTDAVKESVKTLQAERFFASEKTGRPLATSIQPQKADTAKPDNILEVPLTEAQKQIWFLAQIEEEGSIAYQNFMTFRLRGPLNTHALSKSVQDVIDRHEALRTTICRQGDQQRILPRIQITMPTVDFSHLVGEERKISIEQWFTAESRKPFELAEEPPLRVYLLRTSAQEHLLVLTTHHILVDGWSMGVIFQDLSACYAAECQGETWQLSPPMQFREYVQWQRDQHASKAMANHETYWLDQFKDTIPVLDLPTDFPRPSLRTFRGERYTVTLNKDLARRIMQVGAQNGCSLFMTLMAAYFVLLHRVTGQDDIVVGIPTAGRSFDGSENLVGFCSNMLPIRSAVSGTQPFNAFLKSVKQILLAAYEHENYSFANLINKLLLRKGSDRSSLVTMVFNMEPGLAPTPLLDLEAELIPQPVSFAGVDILLNYTEMNGELVLDCDYNTDLFAADTIRRLLNQYETLLREISADPRKRLGELPLLSAAEQRQLLVDWNLTEKKYPKDKCLHELFEARVPKCPDDIAVCFDDQQLTYAELDARSNQVAHYLKSLDVGPEVAVGVFIDRSVEMLIGLLGILKAGGAYVPLDPVYPADRIAYMLSDAQVPVILTQAKLKSELPPHKARVVCMDTDWSSIGSCPAEKPDSDCDPDNLAYIIYTSGSTGKPKGVQILHRTAVNFLNAMARRPGLSAQDIFLAVTTISFDIAVLELYLPLWIGARVVIVSRETAMNGQLLMKELDHWGATVMQGTPATWRLLLRTGWKGREQLKICCGGEALPRELADQLLAGGSSLWNLYGPTETTVYSAVYEVKPERPALSRNAPESIGRPIDNTEIYILDPQLRPVPVGVPGELFIGGEGLARGYRNRPGLTAEKFIPDPFSNRPGARLYSVGDMARYLADGNIEFLGRVDHQVKIRGFRIELGEIEAVMDQHPGVRESVVIDAKGPTGDQHLVGYVLSEKGEKLTLIGLRDFLKQKLPDYMVPAMFVILDEMPLTPNGKVNRKALPAPAASDSMALQNYVAPRTPAEEMVCSIWSDILGVPRVGIHDDFFDLGGHSLLATLVVSRIRETFKVELPLRRLFESSTVAGLIASIETVQGPSPWESAPVLEPVSRPEELPLSFAQERLWFVNELWGPNATYNVPFCLEVDGPLKIEVLELSLTEITRRHDALRTVFPNINGRPIQKILPPTDISVPVVDLEHLNAAEQGVEVQRIGTSEVQAPFDLSEGPLIRAKLLRLSTERHVLLLTIHHMVFDGWSEGIFVGEMAVLYQAYARETAPTLPDLPVQYADYTLWERKWRRDQELEDQLSYWKTQLGSTPELLDLPFDRPRPAVKRYRGGAVSFELSPDLDQALQELCRQCGTTRFMTLLSGFGALLLGYAGQTSMIISAPSANRHRSEVEPLIGFFVSTLLLRIDGAGDPTVMELLDRVRRTTLDAHNRPDVPFMQLVEQLDLAQELHHSSLFQVMMNLQNTPSENLEIADLTFKPLELENVTARYDLTLFDLDLTMSDGPEGLRGELRYCTDLFDATTVDKMVGDFKMILMEMTRNPEKRLSELTSVVSKTIDHASTGSHCARAGR